MLLIVTNEKDLASDYLILRLRERGVDFRRFNTEQLGVSVSVEISLIGNETNFRIDFDDGTVLTRDSISGVYFRQPVPPDYSSTVVREEVGFANTEALELLRSLWRLLPEHLWLNHPKRLWIASNKVEQLVVAVNRGLRIPRTLISANAESVGAFFSQQKGGVVGKAIRHGFVTRDDGLLLAGTQRIPKSFPAIASEFAVVPMTYQEEIEKALDIRVVVIDHHVFSTAITSPDSNTIIDWRISDILSQSLSHSKITLPAAVEDSCRAVVDAFGLRYSSIDMIEDTSGNIIFLELNPNGQWAWLEQLTGHPIRDAIIDALTSRG